MKRFGSSTSGFRARRFLGAAVAVLLLTSIAIGTACSNQGEGERCEIENDSDDCASGLICYSAQKLGGTTDRCCPIDQTKATVAECKVVTALDGAAPEPDSSTTEPDSSTETPDAAGDADAATEDADSGSTDASDQ